MSEYFLKLDNYNYNTQIDFMLENKVYSLTEWIDLYNLGMLSPYEWRKVCDFYELD